MPEQTSDEIINTLRYHVSWLNQAREQHETENADLRHRLQLSQSKRLHCLRHINTLCLALEQISIHARAIQSLIDNNSPIKEAASSIESIALQALRQAAEARERPHA